MSYKILIVDDEAANLRLLERLFRRDYQVVCVSSGIEALEMLNKHNFALIISDQRMPGMTGIEFLKRASEMRPHTVRIILTGYTDVNSLVEAINSGVVYKYVTKPWVNEDLLLTVSRSLEHHETIKRQHELIAQNERLATKLTATQQGLVRFIADALDAKDEYAHGHARRTSGYAVAVGHELDLDSEQLEHLALAAFLHEVGHLNLSDRMLEKRDGDLTEPEQKIVKLKLERGAQMLASIPEMNEIALAVRYQNEHFDGSGFPEKLYGEQIPLNSRIIAAARAYDEMTNPRPSSQSAAVLTHEEAVKKLQSEAGVKYDPRVVEAFSKLDSIGQIRRVIADNMIGMRLLPSRVFSGVNGFSTPELLQKFKTEPLLAMDMLRLSNVTHNHEPTAQLLTAMTKLGEANLRMLIEKEGLPSSADPQTAGWSERSMRCAHAAQLLAAHTNVIHPDEAYTLGLLHDVGEVLLANLFPDKMLALKKLDGENRLQRETEMFGVDSSQVTQWMLEACGIPPTLAAIVKNNYDFMRINNPAALLMQVAYNIANGKEPGKIAGDPVTAECLAMLRLTRMDLNQIYERANAITDNRLEALQEV